MNKSYNVELEDSEILLLHSFLLSGIEGFEISIKGIEGLINDGLEEGKSEQYENTLDDAKVALGISQNLIDKFNIIVEQLMSDVPNSPNIKPPTWGKKED